MNLNLVITSILIQACFAAEAPVEPTLIGRLDSNGNAQFLMDCGSGKCTVPVLEYRPVLGIFKCEEIDYTSKIPPPCRICRVSYGLDGSFDQTAQVEGATLTWTSMYKNQILHEYVSEHVKGLLGPCEDPQRRKELEEYGSGSFIIKGDKATFLNDNNLGFRTNLFPGSKHGSQAGIARYRATASYYNAPTLIGNFLRNESVEGIKSIQTIAYQNSVDFLAQHGAVVNTEYEFIEKDTFGAAMEALDKRPRDHVMVINFANNLSPGGGYLSGAAAQEEDLFRCSNLSWILGGMKGSLYPINTPGSANALFNSHVHIMRDRSQGMVFNTEENIWNYRISVCSLGAFNFNNVLDEAAFDQSIPSVNADGSFGRSKTFTEHGLQVTTDRIRLMFQTAILKGVDTIVLGAFGCGAFGNDPLVIVSLFRQVMEEYHGKIKKVVFAVIGPQENVAPFRELVASKAG